MSCSRSTLDFNYRIGSTPLNRVLPVTDLGIIIDNKLSFSEQIQHVTRRSYQLLDFIYRSTLDFKDPLTFNYLYKTLVMPILNYGSVIWSPYTAFNCKLLEKYSTEYIVFCFLRQSLLCTRLTIIILELPGGLICLG